MALVTGRVWLFPSLGPTAFLQAEAPTLPMSRLYNTLIGHLVGIIAGYLAVIMLGLNGADSVFVIHRVTVGRMWASVIAVTLTLAGQILLKAAHAPAAATTLLITMGGFQRKWSDVADLAVGILIVAFMGECLRRLRASETV
ncbi:MAG: HPP family protein [Armatimonadetes bacterium]|nr:HPP family protein [Armatimonadota bacterium]